MTAHNGPLALHPTPHWATITEAQGQEDICDTKDLGQPCLQERQHRARLVGTADSTCTVWGQGGLVRVRIQGTWQDL